MRTASTFHLDCHACQQPIEFPDGVTTCPKCGAELALEWRQTEKPRPAAPTISDREGLR